MYYPMYQTHKFNVSNCWVPLVVLDKLRIQRPSKVRRLKSRTLLDNTVIGKSRVLSVKDTPTNVDGHLTLTTRKSTS